MNELMLLENPPRRRRSRRTHRRKKSTPPAIVKRTKSKSRRSRRHSSLPNTGRMQTFFLNSHRSDMKHRKKHSRRRFHRNPPFRSGKSGTAGVGGTFKNAAVGAVGILANNYLSGLLGGMLGTASIAGLGSPKTLVKVALPIVAGMTIGRRNQTVRSASTVALAVAIVELVKPMLPASLGLAGENDSIMPALTAYQDGFRQLPSFTGYTESAALPSSIAN